MRSSGDSFRLSPLVKWLKSATAANIRTLTFGAIQAQALLIIASPLLTRLYSPEQFGYLALFTSLSTVLAMAMSGSYERGILVVKEEAEAASLFRLAMTISVSLAVVLTLLLTQVGPAIARVIGKPGFLIWLYFVPAAAMLTAHYQILLCVGNRKQQYVPIARAQVWQSASAISAQLVAAAGGYLTLGFLAGFVLGRLICVLRLTIGLKALGNELIGNISGAVPSLRSTARKHWRFPVFNSSTGLLDVMSMQAAVLIAAQAYSLEAVGYFSLAQRVIGIPLVMIGVGIGEIFYERAARQTRENLNIRKSLWVTLGGLAAAALPIALILFFFSPQLFAFVFGDRWAVSGEYAQILIFVFLGRFIVSPIAHVFAATNTLGILATMRIVYFFVVYVLLSYYSQRISVKEFISLYAVIETGRYLTLVAAAHFVSGRKKDTGLA